MCDLDYRKAFLSDSAYHRGSVPMTKEEVRWLSLLKLHIGSRDKVLDIGAGTGSVTIGAALLAPNGEVIAVEKNLEAVELIQLNADKAGATNIKIISGYAPEALDGLDQFDSIFIGGSGGNMEAMIAWCGQHLVVGGRLVINTITLENGAEASRHVKNGPFETIEIIQVSVARGKSVGSLTMMEAQNPVMILSTTRRKDER